MADLEAYRDKFGESGQRVLSYALGESQRRDQNYIAVEHIISALAKEEPDLFNSTMRGLTKFRRPLAAKKRFSKSSKSFAIASGPIHRCSSANRASAKRR